MSVNVCVCMYMNERERESLVFIGIHACSLVEELEIQEQYISELSFFYIIKYMHSGKARVSSGATNSPEPTQRLCIDFALFYTSTIPDNPGFKCSHHLNIEYNS